MIGNSFAELFDMARQKDSYWTERAKLDFAIEINELLKKRCISRSEFAESIESSPAYVTKILRGDANFTISSMIKIVRALNCRLHIHITPNEEGQTKWFRVLKRQELPEKNTENWPILPDVEGNSRYDEVAYG